MVGHTISKSSVGKAILFVLCTSALNVLLILTTFVAYGITYDIPYDHMTLFLRLMQLYGLLFVPLCIILLLQIVSIIVLALIFAIRHMGETRRRGRN